MSSITSVRQLVPVHGQEIGVVAQDALMDGLLTLPTDMKTRGALALMGCEFWDGEEEFRYVRDNAVSLCGLGGLPIAAAGETPDVVGERIESFAERSRGTMELSAAFSYLNSGNLERGVLYDKVVGLGHLSIAHTVTANVLVAGLTTGVECEFDTQRDLVHLSRVTVARTNVQTDPPVVAPDETSLQVARDIMDVSRSVIAAARSDKPKRDEHEMLNRLFPTAKATALMISGSLRGFQKLVDQRDDMGKELEYRQILQKMHTMFGTIWPEIYT